MRLRPLLRLLAVLVLLVGAQVGVGLALSGTAMAAERVIEIDLEGPTPVTLTGVKVGDTIAFKNTDTTFPHTVRSTSENWSFSESIAPGATFKVPDALKAAGKYTYGDNSPLEDYAGEVQVTATTATKPPTRKPTPRPTRTTSGEPSEEPTTGATPSEEPTGGSGQAETPPLIGGGIPTQSPGSSVLPPPVTAPEPTGTDEAPQEGGGTVALPGGTLPEPPTPREYGLPTAVATVGAAGTASLLVRFLLAHPAGRRRLDGPTVTLDEPRATPQTG